MFERIKNWWKRSGLYAYREGDLSIRNQRPTSRRPTAEEIHPRIKKVGKQDV